MILKMIFGFIVLVIIGGSGFIYGYADGKDSVDCPEVKTEIQWKTINVPVVQECNCSVSQSLCEENNITITNTEEVIVYKEVSSDKCKADVYYQVAIREIDGYYDNIRHDEYEECENKLNRGQDYLLNSIGFYQASDQDFVYKIKAYEELRKVMLKILTYCANYDEDGLSYDDIRDDYEPNYDKYSRYLGYINETPIYIK